MESLSASWALCVAAGNEITLFNPSLNTNNRDEYFIFITISTQHLFNFSREVSLSLEKRNLVYLRTTHHTVLYDKSVISIYWCLYISPWLESWMDPVMPYRMLSTLQWRHNERDGVSNHRRIDCLPNRLFRSRSQKTSKLCVTGLWERNSPVTV